GQDPQVSLAAVLVLVTEDPPAPDLAREGRQFPFQGGPAQTVRETGWHAISGGLPPAPIAAARPGRPGRAALWPPTRRGRPRPTASKRPDGNADPIAPWHPLTDCCDAVVATSGPSQDIRTASSGHARHEPVP